MGAVDLPSGTVTFLLTDVEGSTRLWDDDRGAMSAAVALLDRLVDDEVSRAGGVVVKARGEGDSHFAVFARPSDAASAAIAIQARTAEQPWPTALPVRIRAAVHTGEAELRDGDYYGPTVNRAARLREASHGGQVVISLAATELIRSIPQGTSLVDHGIHRLRDLSEPEHIYELRVSGAGPFPSLRTLEVARHNLPVQLTSFVGRESQVGQVADLVRANRLVTLTGAGGSGKTRLAMQAAADLAGDLDDGVWMVELTPVSSAEAVIPTVAATLGLRDEGSAPARERLLDFLREKYLLLLLDNCEHLIAESAELVTAILKTCARVRVLATTREALGVPGEAVWLVPSLALPHDDSDVECESVRLFAERAALRRPGFVIAESAGRLADICRRLDGIPLAIELAAAKVGILSVEQIADRLDDRFRLLTGGSRTALPRHQTLQAALDWSHDLLSEPERQLLRRLSVFAGGFTIDAAEAVVNVEGELLDLLSQLVSKSLVAAEVGVGTGRYRLLESVRQYAYAKLLAADEVETLRDSHQSWCVAFAADADRAMASASEADALDRVDSEIDNIRSAMRWQGAAGAARATLLSSLAHFLFVRGYGSEFLPAAREILEQRADCSADVIAGALSAAAWIGDRSSTEAATWAMECIALGEHAMIDPACLARAQMSLALHREGKRDDWDDLTIAAVESGDRSENLVLYSFMLYLRAGLLIRGGYQPEGFPLFEVSAEVALRSGAATSIARTARERALHAVQDGNDAAAMEFLDEAEPACRRAGYRHQLARALMLRAGVHRRSAKPELAQGAWDEAMSIFRQLGDRRYLSEALNGASYDFLANGRIDDALDTVTEAADLARSSGDRQAWHTIHSLGEIAMIAGKLELASTAFGEAAAAADESAGFLYADIGTLAIRQGRLADAARSFTEGLARPDQGGVDKVHLLFAIANLALARGDAGVASRLAAAATAARDRERVFMFEHLVPWADEIGSRARAAEPAEWAIGQSDSLGDATDRARLYCEEVERAH